MKKRYLANIVNALVISLLIMPAAVLPQTGSITGVVTDSTNRESLPGANILVEGTVLGAATDASGEFQITGLPSGTHRLIVSMIGYSEKRIRVTLSAGETRKLSVTLRSTSLSTPQLVVTGAKRTVRAQESPVSIGVVSSDEIRTHLPTTLLEVLPYQPGIQVVGGQVNIRGSSGYTRGAGSRVLLLIDGLPMLAGDNGSIYWDAVPANSIERVEVLKGAGSTL